MRKSLISIGSAALALMMFGASIPAADAAPLVPAAPAAAQNDVIQVRDSQFGDRRDNHPGWSNGEAVPMWRHHGWRREGWRDGYRGDGWYNGHRGYRDYRPGYRHYNGFWFPGAAFATGAIIGGAIASQPRYVERRYVGPGMSRRHVEYCMAKYRSYRPSDDTYQPSYGPRRRCM